MMRWIGEGVLTPTYGCSNHVLMELFDHHIFGAFDVVYFCAIVQRRRMSRLGYLPRAMVQVQMELLLSLSERLGRLMNGVLWLHHGLVELI